MPLSAGNKTSDSILDVLFKPDGQDPTHGKLVVAVCEPMEAPEGDGETTLFPLSASD